MNEKPPARAGGRRRTAAAKTATARGRRSIFLGRAGDGAGGRHPPGEQGKRESQGGGAALTGRPLHKLRVPGVGLHRARRAQLNLDALRHSTTSEAASATATLSMRCTPITFPPTNFTRMSSVTEPFAGKAKVSDCDSGR